MVQEIEDYARFLGMDPNSSIDRELMYIAKRGLIQPVPEPWEAQRDNNDMIVYYNTQTGESTHQHPCDEGYRQLFRQKKQALLKERGFQDVSAANDESDITAEVVAAPDKSVDGASPNDPNMIQKSYHIMMRSSVSDYSHQDDPSNVEGAAGIVKSAAVAPDNSKPMKNQVTFYPQQHQLAAGANSYEDELQNADIQPSGSHQRLNQSQFNTSSSGMDPYQYQNYMASIN